MSLQRGTEREAEVTGWMQFIPSIHPLVLCNLISVRVSVQLYVLCLFQHGAKPTRQILIQPLN